MNKQKRFFAWLLALAVAVVTLASCKADAKTEADQTIAASNKSDATIPCEAHRELCVEAIPPRALSEGSRRYACSACGTERLEVIPATGQISVLAIGNSFTQDSMEFLWQICHDAGVKSVKLGYLFLGGSSLQNDVVNIRSNADIYTYSKTTTGEWSVRQSSISGALADDWEIVVLRNYGSSLFTESSKWKYLDELVDYIRDRKPQARLYWHATWAYEQAHIDENYADLVKDQREMYLGMIEVLEGQILGRGCFETIIPCVSAIQNLRTSYLADQLTRDGYHLSYDIGRYTAALTWFCVLSGAPPEVVDWVPPINRGLGEHFPAIREAVAAAVQNPLAVTQSSYVTKKQ